MKDQVAVLRHVFVNMGIKEVRQLLSPKVFGVDVGKQMAVASGSSPIDEAVKSQFEQQIWDRNCDKCRWGLETFAGILLPCRMIFLGEDEAGVTIADLYVVDEKLGGFRQAATYRQRDQTYPRGRQMLGIGRSAQEDIEVGEQGRIEEPRNLFIRESPTRGPVTDIAIDLHIEGWFALDNAFAMGKRYYRRHGADPSACLDDHDRHTDRRASD